MEETTCVLHPELNAVGTVGPNIAVCEACKTAHDEESAKCLPWVEQTVHRTLIAANHPQGFVAMNRAAQATQDKAK